MRETDRQTDGKRRKIRVWVSNVMDSACAESDGMEGMYSAEVEGGGAREMEFDGTRILVVSISAWLKKVSLIAFIHSLPATGALCSVGR